MPEPINTLVYKRTHAGDPDESGIFGIHDCMGRIRDFSYGAVIGVGGKRPWTESKDIALRINWVGIGPHKSKASNAEWSSRRSCDWSKTFRAQLVTFDYYLFFGGGTGPLLKDWAPELFEHMFKEDKRL